MEHPLDVGPLLFLASIGSYWSMYRFRSYSDEPTEKKLLTDELVLEFMEKGVVVIPGVLNKEEIEEARSGLHRFLGENGVNVEDLKGTANELSNLSSTGGAGGILDIFYQDWKLKVNEHPNVVSSIVTLLEHTYAKCAPHFVHPYGPFIPEHVLMYIDRVCFRVPEVISNHFYFRKKTLQRSLAPHLDCCPQRLFASTKAIPKWRPIQAFVALTDTLGPNEGGFEAHPGFHLTFDTWTETRLPSPSKDGQPKEPPCVGDFTPIRPIQDKEVLKGMRHIPCRAGDMVCWDIRIPHANSRHNHSDQAREVAYVGVLPGTGMNRRYVEDQLEKFRAGEVPTDQWHDHSMKQPCSYEFSDIGKKMMTIESYV